MSKYLRCYEIYKEMILEIPKQGVIILTLSIAWVLDFEKVAYELSGSFAKVRTPPANNNSSSPSEDYHKNIFLDKSFDWNILYRYHKLFI